MEVLLIVAGVLVCFAVFLLGLAIVDFLAWISPAVLTVFLVLTGVWIWKSCRK